eukprot:scaffold330079_cov66-Tisochrysis_lutea.AAC.1
MRDESRGGVHVVDIESKKGRVTRMLQEARGRSFPARFRRLCGNRLHDDSPLPTPAHTPPDPLERPS